MCGKLEYWESQKMKLSKLQKISSSLGQRFYTLELAYNILNNYKLKNITQVGVQSKDFEYANFDLFNIFADLTLDDEKITYDIYVNHQDINLKNRILTIQRDLYKNYNPDNISVLDINEKKEEGKIDLLVLHDICYPINEITQKISKNFNYLEARNLLNSLTEEEMDLQYGDIINPCREKMLKEYKMFNKRLGKTSIVLLEGNDYPGGSQTLLVKEQLKKEGFYCLLDLKQSIWLKN